MSQEINSLTFGGVNFYLVKTNQGFILIDTGYTKNRQEIEKELQAKDCPPTNLKLILLTHGDFDHSGNARYLREKIGGKIAMHQGDKGIVEQGDLFSGRKMNFLMRGIGKIILFFLKSSFSKEDRFIPDFYVEEGYDLSEFGLNAKVVYLPGHSNGSIGILTASGVFFCGDLLVNIKQPAANSLIGNKEMFKNSLRKLKTLNITIVYPGHGKPFTPQELWENQKSKV